MIKKFSTALFLSSLIYCQQSLAQGVFQTYQMDVSNPAAVVAAIDKFTSSLTSISLFRVFSLTFMKTN